MTSHCFCLYDVHFKLQYHKLIIILLIFSTWAWVWCAIKMKIEIYFLNMSSSLHSCRVWSIFECKSSFGRLCCLIWWKFWFFLQSLKKYNSKFGLVSNFNIKLVFWVWLREYPNKGKILLIYIDLNKLNLSQIFRYLGLLLYLSRLKSQILLNSV